MVAIETIEAPGAARRARRDRGVQAPTCPPRSPSLPAWALRDLSAACDGPLEVRGAARSLCFRRSRLLPVHDVQGLSRFWPRRPSPGVLRRRRLVMRTRALMRRSLVAGAVPSCSAAASLLFVFQLVVVGQASAIERPELVQPDDRAGAGLPAARPRKSKAMLLVTFKGRRLRLLLFDHRRARRAGRRVSRHRAAHEVEAGLVDLELARAVPRHVLITRPPVSALLVTAAAMIVMASGTWLGLRAFASPVLRRCPRRCVLLQPDRTWPR